jgi:hypothetical protein
MLDCVILVIKSFRVQDGRYKLKVRWMNNRGMDLGITENVTITREEVGNWYEWKGK